MSPTFRSLRVPNYRLWAAGAIVSNTGTWMQRVAQDWLVLTELTDDSGTAVGITTGLQFAPMLLLAPVAGAVADRFSRRRVLFMTQSLMGVLGLALGALVLTDAAQLWQVYVLAGLLGVGAAFDAPARQAFVSEMVTAEDLPNAVSLNSASFHAGRLIGPGVAGLLIHWFGTGPVFLINGLTFGAVVLSLTRMRVADLRPAARSRAGHGSIREGLSYVRSRPDLVLILTIVGVVGMFGLNFQLTTALMARMVFDKGSGEFGLLGSVMAIGSLGGALLAARRERPRLRLLIGATLAFGVASTVAAVMPSYWLFAIALVPVGLSSLTLMTAANATMQLNTDPSMRGRVMALYMAVFMGGTPIGSPVIGWIGEEFGARWTILLGGAASVLTAAGAVIWLLRTGRVRVRGRRSWPFLEVVGSEGVAAGSPAASPAPVADAAPGGAAVEAAAPEAVAPGNDAPSAAAPGAAAPGVVAPEAVVSNTAVPGVAAPGVDAGNTAVPGAVVPGADASNPAVPKRVGAGTTPDAPTDSDAAVRPPSARTASSHTIPVA